MKMRLCYCVTAFIMLVASCGLAQTTVETRCPAGYTALQSGRVQLANGNIKEYMCFNSATGDFYFPNAVNLFGGLTGIASVTTQSNTTPVSIVVSQAVAVNQTANIASTSVYTVPASQAGMYRITCYTVVTQAATTSSTTPTCQLRYTDSFSNVTNSGLTIADGGLTTNTVGHTNFLAGNRAGNLTFYAKASTTIEYSLTGYVSSGATPMAYTVVIKLEYLGS